MLPVQRFPWELALLALFLFLAYLAWRGIRRRRAFAVRQTDVELPRLETPQRVTAILRRTYRDPAQGVWLVEAQIGPRRVGSTSVTFCATDYDQNGPRYEGLLGKPAELALFALATLAEGGVEAMKDQIKDLDKIEMRPDLVALAPAGEFANDRAVIGRALDAREAAWDEMPLTVYRTQVVRTENLTLVLDLAVPRDAAPPFAPNTMVHGSARLFGYLAS